ncbi:unnamed protein product [Polarella glacialis]|uniref:MYND-type domain-containing protein n=1 Tax=Polarella glacialis TaxID=89957 RepID=A0A813HE72_POLGL|nr:unnamed protein product [Polarella glacialis]
MAELADRINNGFGHRRVQDHPSFGDESFVFGGDEDPVSKLLQEQYGSDVPCFLNVLIRVGNVVAKLFVSIVGSADKHAPDIYALAGHVSERLTSWVQRFGLECCTAIQSLPDPALCAYDALQAAHRALAQRSLRDAAGNHSSFAIANSVQTCASCGVQSRSCNRCGGCYRYFLCGTHCQRQFWESGHKIECSREFELTILTNDSVRRSF